MSKAPQSKSAVAEVSKNTQLATSDNSIPEFLRNTAGHGLENVGSEDVETPRLKLLQATSPELDEFEEARAGMFWNTIAQVSLGREVTVVPIYIDKRAILWRPQETGGGILARSDDNVNWNPPNATFDVKLKNGKLVRWTTKPTVAASRLLDWGTSDPDDPNSQPAATQMYSIVVVTPGMEELPPSVVTLQRSSIAVAKKFLGQLRLSRVASYGCKYIMTSVKEEGPSGSYYNYKFTPAGFVTNEEEFSIYKSYHESLREMGLRLRDIDMESDPIGPSSNEDPGY